MYRDNNKSGGSVITERLYVYRRQTGFIKNIKKTWNFIHCDAFVCTCTDKYGEFWKLSWAPLTN